MPSNHENNSRGEDRSIQNIQILNYFSLTSELNTSICTQAQHAPQGKKNPKEKKNLLIGMKLLSVS